MIQTCEHPVYLKDKNIYVSCGHCAACVSSYRRRWLDRLDLEAKSSAAVLFFTLTYDNEHAPTLTYEPGANALYSNRTADDNIYLDDYPDVDLSDLPVIPDKFNKLKNKDLKQFTYACKTDLQKFFKRLRRQISYDKNSFIPNTEDKGLRYFAVSEYGPNTHRAHYHGLLYFSSKLVARAVAECYFSKAWHLCSPDNLRCEFVSTSASSYVAKYLHCTTALPSVLRIDQKTYPFYLCSRRPAIGCNYFNYNDLLSKVEQRSLLYCKTINSKDGISVVNKNYPKAVLNYFFEKPYKACLFDVSDLFSFFNAPFSYLGKTVRDQIKGLDYISSYNIVSSYLPCLVNEVDELLDARKDDNDSFTRTDCLSDLYPYLSLEQKRFGISTNRRVLIRSVINMLNNNISTMDYVEQFLSFHSLKFSTSMSFMYDEYNKMIANGVSNLDAFRFIYPSFFRDLPDSFLKFVELPDCFTRLNILDSFSLSVHDIYEGDGDFASLYPRLSPYFIFNDLCNSDEYTCFKNNLNDEQIIFEKVRQNNHFNNNILTNNNNEIF